MVSRLGAVALCFMALTACVPWKVQGRVIVGLDDAGALVAVLGACVEHDRVELSIYETLPKDSEIPSASRGLPRTSPSFADARHENSTTPMRIELRRDRAPEGWSSRRWQLPDTGQITISAVTWDGQRGSMRQRLVGVDVDLAAVPALPADADQQAVSDC